MTIPTPEPQLPPAALAALARGDKIGAIKIVRVEAGLGLKEAKDAVEAHERAHPGVRGSSPVARGDPAAGRTWLLVLLALAVVGLCYAFLGR